ncbi:D-Ala-D-Ala carboxypeptidase family metallohydrolase [soil metagenome]
MISKVTTVGAETAKMSRKRASVRLVPICSLVLLSILVAAWAPASAYPFQRVLRRGSRGADVKALETRVAGWYPRGGQTRMALNRIFGLRTKRALEAFQAHYGLFVDGIAGPATFKVLDRLENKNGSTAHFEWGEFKQNFNSSCGAQANAYAGTFGGGMVAPRRAKRNARRLMWRLEAVRAKGSRQPIGVNSGFRSVEYNSCIGGAALSQHMYGTAADNRMVAVSNRTERVLAKRSQLSGIGCYSSLSHNHFDLRLDNGDLPAQRAWWWPQKDSKGRDLDATGRPCWGEKKRAAKAGYGESRASREQAVGGNLVPTEREIQAFETAGEVSELGSAD